MQVAAFVQNLNRTVVFMVIPILQVAPEPARLAAVMGVVDEVDLLIMSDRVTKEQSDKARVEYGRAYGT
jgi:hypothetical protein